MSNQKYSLRSVTEDDYDFIYQVKKDAYKKHVELCFGSWDEEQQKEYFRKFIETYKEGAFIISFDGKEIGFYNGCAIENTYEIGNICIVPEYQNRGIGTAVLKDVLAENAGKKITLQYFKQNPRWIFVSPFSGVGALDLADIHPFHYGAYQSHRIICCYKYFCLNR